MGGDSTSLYSADVYGVLLFSCRGFIYPVVYMNRELHRQQFEYILASLEKRFAAKVYKALRGQYQKFIDNIRIGGLSYARSELIVEVMNVQMGEVVKEIHLKAGIFMANRTLSALKKNASHRAIGQKGAAAPTPLSFKYQSFGFNDEWINDILQYFQSYLLDKAVIAVSNTTRSRILEVLNIATEQGWSNNQIINKLSDLQEIRGRARMIVRTETVRAANYGVLLGADKYDFEVVKEWVSVLDNRVRHTHRTNDAERREVDQPFSNGLMFPGDPNGPAKETIQCRCSIVMVAKRDEQGRLIPKQRTIPIKPIRIAA